MTAHSLTASKVFFITHYSLSSTTGVGYYMSCKRCNQLHHGEMKRRLADCFIMISYFQWWDASAAMDISLMTSLLPFLVVAMAAMKLACLRKKNSPRLLKLLNPTEQIWCFKHLLIMRISWFHPYRWKIFARKISFLWKMCPLCCSGCQMLIRHSFADYSFMIYHSNQYTDLKPKTTQRALPGSPYISHFAECGCTWDHTKQVVETLLYWCESCRAVESG